MKNRVLLFLTVLLCFTACKKDKERPSYYKGEMTVFTDESFKSVTEALAEGYSISYPESEIKVVTKKEDLAFLDLLDNKARLIVMSRDLSEAEKAEYKKRTQLDFTPARFAADAVLFVVPAESEKTSVSMDEIKSGLMSSDKPFIFDGTNSSNLNFVAQEIGKKPSELKFSTINGNTNVINDLAKYPGKIGVISLNTLSRPYDPEAEKLRKMVKILPVSVNGSLYEANPESLEKMSYPFTRVLYFLVNENGFNLANGFIRFSCTQIGQKIVEKEGLQPYNLYRREVQMR